MQWSPAVLTAVLCFVSILSSGVFAQIPPTTSTTSTPVPGAGHDYLGELVETVNPANGSVSFRLPVIMPPGRGLTLPFAFAYDSNGVNYLSRNLGGYQVWNTTHSVISQGGWSSAAPVVSVAQLDWTSFDYNNHSHPCHAWVNYVFQDANGNRHNLNVSNYYDPGNGTGSCTYDSNDWPYGFNSDLVGQGSEGPIQASIQANYRNGGGPVTVTDGDGTVFYFPYSSGTTSVIPSSVEDRNGNKVSIAGTLPAFNYVDTVGRTVLQDSGVAVSPETVTVSGLGAPYKLTWTTLSTPSFTTQVTTLQGTCGSPSFNSQSWTNIHAVASLQLPNNKSFSFTYDPLYGLVNRITYPTGAYIRYVWGMNIKAEYGSNAPPAPSPLCVMLYAVPAITDRYVSFDGTTEVQHQHFAYSNSWQTNPVKPTTKQTTVTTTDLVRNTSFNTIYNYSDLYADIPPNTTGGPSTYDPVESSIAYYDTDATLIKTVSKTWTNPRLLISETTTYPGGQANESTWSYNSREQQTEQDDYDFGSSGVGSLLRKVVTNYQGFGNTPLYPNAPSIVDRPCQVITYDSTGTTRVAETDYFYDNGVTTVPCGAAGTPSVTSAGGSSLTGHDETNYSASSTYPRGNLTQKTQWLNSGGSSPVTTYSYDATGQTLSMTDPNGNTTTYSYADNYLNTNTGGYTTTAGSPPSGMVTNAYLTKITQPPIGAVAHVTQFAYGYDDGELTQSTDENSQSTTYRYNDSFGRLTERDYPDTGQTTLSYNDSAPSITTVDLITNSPAVSLSTTKVMDGLGHPVQTELTTDPDGPTYTAIMYDGNGRPYQVYNPTRCSPPTTNCGTELTWGTSTYTYDALGRAIAVTRPDGSSSTTSYSANSTTVTDEIGNQRTTQVDGLGRMTNVAEAPNDSGYNFQTQYTYDALNDLTGVTQNGSNSAKARVRSFVYDTLARLTSAANPESGTILYAYDGNGNVITKTAPAPNHSSGTVQTNYSYDVLNRLTKKTYTDGSTASVQYGYDGVALTGCTTGPPSLTDPYPVGTRTAMCDGSGATSWSHDKMGRPATLDRNVGGFTRSATYQYNLDGSLSLETIFSGKQLQYTYGGAGRVLSLTDPSASPAYNFVTSATYTPNGALARAAYAAGSSGFNGFTETDLYNARLQPIVRFASSSAGTAISLCYDFHLKTAVSIMSPVTCSFAAGSGDNGNVFQVVNNRDTTRTQNFTYDKLNRITSGYTTSSLWGTTYVIDAWSNLTNMNGISGKTNSQSLQAAPASNNNQLNGFCHDVAGNLVFDIACPTPPWSSTTYVYDAENRLKAAGGAVYVYDGDGNRVEKLIGGTGTLYWRESNGELTNETDTNNVTLHRHVYFDGRRLARTDTQPTYSQHFYFSDHLGSANVVANGANGSIEEDSDYYPYGGELVFTNTVPQNYKFTGKERDTESGLDYFGRRHYASTMGRWMTPDPLNLTRARLINPTNTLNKYVYGGNNPLKYIDRDGEDITIFYRPPSGASGDYGHIMLGALNQATGKVGFLDYYPAGKVNGLGQGPGAFNTGNMSERAAQNADGKFATLTIQTSPEQAQKVIDLIGALKNGSTPDYSALTNNCTTVCEDVLKDLGLDFGDVFPSSYWADVYNNFSADAQAHPIWTMMMGVHGTPGNEYGNPRNFPGVNNFSQWLFTLYMNQQQKPQPKACVEVDDGLGNHSKSCE